MPAYNAEKYIGEAIESILNQTFKDFEFIIIDDCSTDGTWGIIQKYAAKDKRIVVLKNEENLGISPTRNKLIGFSKGKYVVWQDADDISMSYRIEHQYDFMEKNPEVGICGGYLQFFSEKGLGEIRKYAVDDVSLRRTIFRYSPVSQGASILRKDTLNTVGDFNERLIAAEDLDLSFRIGTQGRFANLQEILLNYRQTPNGSTFSQLRKMELNTIKVRRQYLRDPAYSFSIVDFFYNTAQFISIYLIPPHLKIKLFNLFRNDKA